MSDRKLGLFICDCGEQIASILDMDFLEQGARDLPGVACVRRLRYSCSPDGLDAIVSATREGGLDRVLVAGFPPRLHQRHFRDACTNRPESGVVARQMTNDVHSVLPCRKERELPKTSSSK